MATGRLDRQDNTSAISDQRRMNPDYQMIDTAEGLARAVAAFKGAREVAVDLEADSMYHYQEKVCLIQMATDDLNFVIDPLVIDDLSPLRPIFSKRSVRKVFHGSDYDVRSFYRDFEIVIHNLFDTQVAAMFLGMRETGLDAVLQQRFGIHLDKKYQKKDWSCVPSPRHDRIRGRGRHPSAPPGPGPGKGTDREKPPGLGPGGVPAVERRPSVRAHRRASFLRIKGAGKLDRRGLAVLENLLGLRHGIASKKDRPLFKVFSNKSLMKMPLNGPKPYGDWKKAAA